MKPEERFFDEQVVRPYVMTRGRTEPRAKLDLISLAMTIRPIPAAEIGLDPEHTAITRLCRDPLSVAEIASHLDLPAGTVRVLLGDLLERGFVAVQEPRAITGVLDDKMYKAVLDGLRAL